MTTSSEVPTFHCEKLQSAFNNARPIFDGFEKRFDRVSEDIKLLESYLTARNVRYPIVVPLYFAIEASGGSRYKIEATGTRPGIIKENFSGTPGVMHSHSLVWDEVKKLEGGKRYRIQYEHTLMDGELQMDEQGLPYISKCKSRETDRHVLIECSLETRLLVREYLPLFVEHIAAKLG